MTAGAVRAAFRAQARACAGLGSPLMADLCNGLADMIDAQSPLGSRILGWPGDPLPGAESLPLRLAGGLHALVLSGADSELAAAYAAGHPVAAALAAMQRHAATLDRWLDSPPQTNEVRRSAVLIAAAAWMTKRFGKPLVLSEMGTSAGLNLLFDRYTLTLPGRRIGPTDPVLDLTPDWRGNLPPQAEICVTDRAGVDLNPLDPVADLLHLLAYLWADQADRIARTKAAADEAARLRPAVARGDAGGWLEARLAKPHPGHLHLIFHTIAWQYFPKTTQAQCADAIMAAGAHATDTAPVAHLAMEQDGQPGSAALTLRLWPGSQVIPLGRADFHGRWVDWRAPSA